MTSSVTRLPSEILERICSYFVEDLTPVKEMNGQHRLKQLKMTSSLNNSDDRTHSYHDINHGYHNLCLVDPGFLAAKKRAENRQTLIACLLVNREWFQCALPFLWQHPQLHLLSTELLEPGNEELWTRKFADLVRIVELPPEHYQERRRRRRDHRFNPSEKDYHYQPVNDGEMMALIAKCRYLQRVDLTPLSHLSTLAAMDSMMTVHREYARRRSDPDTNDSPSNVTDENFKEPSTGLLYLDYTIDALVNSRHTLQSLSMRCWNGSAYAQAFWPTLLEKFEKSIRRSSPALFGRLQKLDVSESYLLTDATFTQPLFGGFFSLMPQLTHLNISSLPFLTDQSIQLIMQKCPRLKELNIAYCPQITDQSLVMMQNCQPFRDTLEVLHIGGCCGLTSHGLQSLFAGNYSWTKLLELNMTYLPVTDLCLDLISENVPNIQSIRLMSCKQITADSVANLIMMRGYATDKDAQKLDWLDLSFCDGVLPEYMGRVATQQSEIGDRLLFAWNIKTLIYELRDVSEPHLGVADRGCVLTRAAISELKTLLQLRQQQFSSAQDASITSQ